MRNYQYFLGIDISKESFDFCLLNSISNNPLENQKLKMNKQGFEKVVNLITNHIARFAKARYNELKVVDKNSIASLKTLNRQKEDFSETITKVKSQIKNLLNKLFPELERITNPFSKTIINLLSKAPSPQKIIQKGLDFIKKQINSTNGGKINTAAKTILKKAQNSTGLNDQHLETTLLAQLNLLTVLKKELKNIEKAIKDAICINENIKINVNLITSIKGIGKKTAIPFLIETGILGSDIEEIFPSYKQLIAYAGTDPSLKQSGSSIDHRGSISKKGNKYLRKIIYLMAQNTVRYNGYFKRYFNKKLKEGKVRNQALIAVGNKLIKIFYTLLKNKVKYDAEYHLQQVDWIA